MGSKEDLYKQLQEIEKEQDRRFRMSAMKRQKPYWFQQDIHDAVEDNRIICLFGGNGVGKTETAVREALSWILGERAWDGTKTPKVPPVRVLYIGPDFTNFHPNKLIPTILTMMPFEAWASTEKNNNGVIKAFHHPNGSVLSLMSYEQHTRKSQDQISPFEGIDYDFAIFDEPPPLDVFNAVMRGVTKRRGKAMMVMTPLSEPWIFDSFYSGERKDIHIQTNSIFDAVQSEANPRGHMTREDVEAFLEDVPEEERVARRDGHFRHLIGRVYRSFDEGVHVFDPDRVEISPDWPKGLTIDPHDRRPFMMTWFAVTPQNQVLFFKEEPCEMFHKLKSTEMTWESYVDLIRRAEQEIPGGPDSIKFRFLDPNFGVQRKAVTGQSLQDYLAIEGLYFYTDFDDSLSRGHAAVQRALQYDREKPLSQENMPRIRVSRECQNILYGFSHYVWGNYRDSEKNAKEKPKEHAKDPMDCIRYTMVNDPIYAVLEQRWGNTHNMSSSKNYGLG